MSSIMKPPPESSVPPPPYSAAFPGYMQPRRPSQRRVWMTVGVVALLCILAGVLAWGGTWAFTTYYNSAYRASDMYYSAIKTQDYATAYSYLGSGLQREYNLQAFTQAAQQQDAALEKVSRFSMPNFPTGEPASITLTVTRGNGTTYDVHLVWQQEGGAWKVTAFDRI